MTFVGKLFIFLTLLPLAQQSSGAHWSVSQDLQSFDFVFLCILTRTTLTYGMYGHFTLYMCLQLGDTLIAANPSLDIQMIDVEKEGICIRFSPLETAQG